MDKSFDSLPVNSSVARENLFFYRARILAFPESKNMFNEFVKLRREYQENQTLFTHISGIPVSGFQLSVALLYGPSWSFNTP